MSLKEQMKNDFNSLFLNEDEFGERVTYEGTEIIALFNFHSSMEEGNIYGNDGRSSRATITISVDDIPNPKQGDKIVRDEVTWEVARKLVSDSISHKLELITDERAGWRR